MLAGVLGPATAGIVLGPSVDVGLLGATVEVGTLGVTVVARTLGAVVVACMLGGAGTAGDVVVGIVETLGAATAAGEMLGGSSSAGLRGRSLGASVSLMLCPRSTAYEGGSTVTSTPTT